MQIKHNWVKLISNTAQHHSANTTTQQNTQDNCGEHTSRQTQRAKRHTARDITIERQHLLAMLCFTHFLGGWMTKLEGEHDASISRQRQTEESIQGHLFSMFHKNFFYLPRKVVIRFLPLQTLSPKESNAFENNQCLTWCE